MVNDDYQPTKAGEKVLSVFKEGQQEAEPWGRANPRYLIDKTDLSKSNVEYQLRSLNDAGWIDKVTRGLYEYVDDPREEQASSDDTENPEDTEQDASPSEESESDSEDSEKDVTPSDEESEESEGDTSSWLDAGEESEGNGD